MAKHTYIIKCSFHSTSVSLIIKADSEALALEKAARHPIGKGAERYIVKERPE